jgi:hypothetical protein
VDRARRLSRGRRAAAGLPPKIKRSQLAGHGPNSGGGICGCTAASYADATVKSVGSSTPHERATVQDSTKPITGIDGARSYDDLAADPGETNPNAVAPDRRVALDRSLESLRVAGRDPRRGVAIDAETRERVPTPTAAREWWRPSAAAMAFRSGGRSSACSKRPAAGARASWSTCWRRASRGSVERDGSHAAHAAAAALQEFSRNQPALRRAVQPSGWRC